MVRTAACTVPTPRLTYCYGSCSFFADDDSAVRANTAALIRGIARNHQNRIVLCHFLNVFRKRNRLQRNTFLVIRHRHRIGVFHAVTGRVFTGSGINSRTRKINAAVVIPANCASAQNTVRQGSRIVIRFKCREYKIIACRFLDSVVLRGVIKNHCALGYMDSGFTRGAKPQSAALPCCISGNQCVGQVQRAVIIVIALAVNAAAHIGSLVSGNITRFQLHTIGIGVDATAGAADVAGDGTALHDKGSPILRVSSLQVAVHHADACTLNTLVAGNFAASHGKFGIALNMDCTGTFYFTDSRASIIADCTISGQFKGGSVIFVISPEHNCAAPMSGVSGNRAAGHRSAGVFIQQKTGRTVQRRGNRSVVVGNLAAGDFDMCTIACADNSAVRYPIAGQGIIRDFAARQGKDCVFAAAVNNAHAD